MPAPTYVLIADRSSLVMRPPSISSRLTLIEAVSSGIRQDGNIQNSNIEHRRTRDETASPGYATLRRDKCGAREHRFINRSTQIETPSPPRLVLLHSQLYPSISLI